MALTIYLVRIFAKITVPTSSLGYDDYCISTAMVRSSPQGLG